MNFTKEYIKECDCREIQELLDDLIEKGSYYLERNSGYVNLSNHYIDNEGNIWLPTGDQLDQEIVKFVKQNKKYWRYSISFQVDNSGKDSYFAAMHSLDENGPEHYENESNPLIAKIKLLKALLKEE
jgi:hypothetical protein